MMLLVSEIVRSGGTPRGSYRLDRGTETMDAVAAARAVSSGLAVVPADQDTVDTIAAWHRQNGRVQRAEQIEEYCRPAVVVNVAVEPAPESVLAKEIDAPSAQVDPSAAHEAEPVARSSKSRKRRDEP